MTLNKEKQQEQSLVKQQVKKKSKYSYSFIVMAKLRKETIYLTNYYTYPMSEVIEKNRYLKCCYNFNFKKG